MDEQTAIAIALVGAGGATVGAEEDELVRPGHAGGDRLGYVHIGESHRGFLGSGHLDFTGSPHTVADIGCRGPVTLETFSSAVQAPEQSHNLAIWRDTWTDGEALALHARRFFATRLASHSLANA